MNPTTAAILLIIAALGSSCASNEQLEQRLNHRNEAHSSRHERHEIRADARQERTDMWYERHMN
ncbi:MAG TPA: hypothetical protein VF258_09125 [Luteolibacter sp.]